jgi:hypothetical protein
MCDIASDGSEERKTGRKMRKNRKISGQNCENPKLCEDRRINAGKSEKSSTESEECPSIFFAIFCITFM